LIDTITIQLNDEKEEKIQEDHQKKLGDEDIQLERITSKLKEKKLK
jgi:hypothetical protein